MPEYPTSPTPPLIRVKLLGKTRPGEDSANWLRFFPNREPIWGRCRFIFDRDSRDYDWLVVYDDLPSAAGERRTLWREPLACAPDHTLLITVEPSTIKVYGSEYLRQFRWLLTTQEDWATGFHPGRLFEQPALAWFYGRNSPRGDYDNLLRHPPLAKTRGVSTVCSDKRQGHTLNAARYAFVMALKARMPELDVFGRGIRPVEDKADALDAYRYHLVIENFSGPHHWTEKLADAFLGCCLPFYHGCTNIEDYFPAESVVAVDLADVAGTAEALRRAEREDLYGQRLAAVLESRRRVLECYGPIPTISRIVEARHDPALGPVEGSMVESRHRVNRRRLFGLAHALEKRRLRGRLRRAGG